MRSSDQSNFMVNQLASASHHRFDRRCSLSMRETQQVVPMTTNFATVINSVAPSAASPNLLGHVDEVIE
jgi:hypothetical protein